MSVARQPLVHFAVIGALIFGAAALRDHVRRRRSPPADDPRVIVVRPDLARALRSEAARRTGTIVTPELSRSAVQAYVDEEILYREALALGLDRGDPIVRRRLVQEMEAILRGLDARPEPDDRELGTWIDTHRDRYMLPARVAFRQVFVSRERRGDEGLEIARTMFAQLEGHPVEHADGLGDPFSVGADVPAQSERDIATTFGPSVAAAVMRATGGHWNPPIESPVGWFVIFVREHIDARLARVDEVRSRALEDFRVEHGDRALAAAIGRLRSRYVVR